MTLNDLERRNSPYFAFSSNSIALLATVVEDRPIIRKYCLPVPVFHFEEYLFISHCLQDIAQF